MNDHDSVVLSAWEFHQAHWQLSGDESTGDQLASKITRLWQERIQELAPDRYVVEHQIAPHLRQRIDVVDVIDGIAYELKVSPNNVHMEFYRDIFKVLLARDNGLPQLRRFVFLTPVKSASKLMTGMGKAVMDEGSRFGLRIEVIGLGPSDQSPVPRKSRSAKLAEIEEQLRYVQALLKETRGE